MSASRIRQTPVPAPSLLRGDSDRLAQSFFRRGIDAQRPVASSSGEVRRFRPHDDNPRRQTRSVHRVQSPLSQRPARAKRIQLAATEPTGKTGGEHRHQRLAVSERHRGAGGAVRIRPRSRRGPKARGPAVRGCVLPCRWDWRCAPPVRARNRADTSSASRAARAGAPPCAPIRKAGVRQRPLQDSTLPFVIVEQQHDGGPAVGRQGDRDPDPAPARHRLYRLPPRRYRKIAPPAPSRQAPAPHQTAPAAAPARSACWASGLGAGKVKPRLLPRIQPRDNLRTGRAIGIGVDQDIQSAAAGQAKIDLVGTRAIADHAPLATFGNLARKFLFQATIGKAAGNAPVRMHGQLRAKAAREAAFDMGYGAQAHARLAGRAHGGLVACEWTGHSAYWVRAGISAGSIPIRSCASSPRNSSNATIRLI